MDSSGYYISPSSDLSFCSVYYLHRHHHMPAILSKCVIIRKETRSVSNVKIERISLHALMLSTVSLSVLLILCAFICVSLGTARTPVKVVIAGGGPAGLFAANALLSRTGTNQDFHVHLVEAKEDPRFAAVGPRSYSLGVNIRGQNAFQYFEQQGRLTKLWSKVKQEGIDSDSFFLHLGKFKLQIRKPSKENRKSGPPPTLLIPRNKLCTAMLENLEEEYGSTGRFTAHFNTKINEVDFQSCKVAIGGESANDVLAFDLLLGCDGVRSAVRKAIEQSRPDEFVCTEEKKEGGYVVLDLPHPPNLEKISVHALEGGKGFSLFCIPAKGSKEKDNGEGRMNTLLAWRGSDPPAFLQKDIDEDIDTWTRRVQETITAAYPQISPLPLSSITPLRSQRPSEVRIVRCNQYHYQGEAGGSALLLGDAAHCTGGTLGQGANSALQDVVMLDQVLNEVGDDLRALPSLFTQRAHPEGEALYSLLQLPPRGWGRLRYELAQAWRRARGQQSTQQLLSQSLTPFSQISRQNNYWIDMATNQKTAASSLPIKSSSSV